MRDRDARVFYKRAARHLSKGANARGNSHSRMENEIVRKLLLTSAMGAIGVLCATSVQALPTSYSVGGLTFSNITCASGSTGTATGNCDGLAIADAPGGNGIQFQGLLATASGPASSLDVIIGYQITSTTPFSAVGLSFNGVTFGSGVARAEVVETAYSAPGGALLGQTNVGTPSPLSSTLDLGASLTSAYLVKDIGLFSFPDGDLTGTSISFVTQTFPTGGNPPVTPVPEPASMALLGAGLLALGMVRRKGA